MELSKEFVAWSLNSYMHPKIGALLCFWAAVVYLARYRQKTALAWYFVGLGGAWLLLSVTFFLFSVGQLSLESFRYYARLGVYILATVTLVEHGGRLFADVIKKIKSRFWS